MRDHKRGKHRDGPDVTEYDAALDLVSRLGALDLPTGDNHDAVLDVPADGST